MKIAFSFFLLIYSWCGAPASWAARHTIVCLDLIISKLPTEECDRSVNIPRSLHKIRQIFCTFIKGAVLHQHITATHVLVFMISNEEINRQKPYALPVQCLPYKGLSDAKVWKLANEIINEMIRRGMKVAGK